MGFTSAGYTVDVECVPGRLDKERPELTHMMLSPFWSKKKAMAQARDIIKMNGAVRVEVIYGGAVIYSKTKQNVK